MAFGKDIGAKAPAPDKLGSYGSKPADDGDETPGETETDEDKAARVSQMQEVIDAFKAGDAETACDKLDQYLDSRK